MIGSRVFVQIIRIVSTVWHNYLVQPVVRRLPIKPGKRVLCFGDSNTWGYIPSSGFRYRFEKRWPGILQQELGTGFCVIEEGLNGRTTVLDDPERGGRNGKKSLLQYMHRYQPVDLVILLIGTNDLKTHFNRTAEHIADGIRELGQMVLKSQTSSDGKSPILLLIVPPPIRSIGEYANLFEGAEEKSNLLAEKVQLVANELHCEILDAATVIQSSGIDGLHWDENDHRKLGVMIAKKIHDPLV